MTVDQYLDIDQHPLLIVAKDLFVSITEGQRFTKLDLAQAYQQMPLDGHSALLTFTKDCTSSTAVVWSGICSSYFQCSMDIPYVLYYIEDFLITDETEETFSQPREGAERIVDPWNCAQEVQMFLLTRFGRVLGTHH